MTHMGSSVGVRELRQNLSRYLGRVKAGEAFVVTERGSEVARLTPSGGGRQSALARLIAERGATIPRGDLIANLGPRHRVGRSTADALAEQREERL